MTGWGVEGVLLEHLVTFSCNAHLQQSAHQPLPRASAVTRAAQSRGHVRRDK